MSAREAGKQKRREQILAAAEDLIRAEGNVSFSMRTLAERACVALVTPFNLFGGKGVVLRALLEARLDAERERVATASSDDPVERVLDLARHAARAYTSDAPLVRPLLRALSDVEGLGHAALFERAVELWGLALRDAVAAGMIEPDLRVELLARSLHLMFRGSLAVWVLGEMSAAQFERQAEYGSALCVLGALTGEAREALLERIPELEPRR